MSIGTLETTMARIKAAHPHSPISVFIVEKKVKKKTKRFLDARFASTVGALRRKQEVIKPRITDEGLINWAHEWIGDYHRWHQVKGVRALLKVALEK
jgi:hypothetical protein